MVQTGGVFGLGGLERVITQAVQSAVEVTMPSIMEDHGLEERNGYGQFKWNPIIAHLRSECNHLGWTDFGVCNRRGWKLPVLFHPQSKMLITLMTEPTLQDLQRRKNKGTHYLCAASAYNPNVKAKYEQTMLDLPPVDVDMSWIEKSQEQLTSCVDVNPGEVEGHILVVIDCKGDKVESVRALCLTPKLEESTEEENWSEYLTLPFAETQDTVLPQQLDDDDEDDLVDFV